MHNREVFPQTRGLPSGSRWLGGAVVLALHVLVLLALLLHSHIKIPIQSTAKSMVLFYLNDETPPRPPNLTIVTLPKSVTPPATPLIPPQFNIAPTETKRSSAITVLPEERAQPPSTAPSRRLNYNDLFSADKKEQLKGFFNNQVAEDRRENAKAGNSKTACDTFKKQDDLGEAGQQSNTGISQNFKPGLVIGAGGSDQDKPFVHACN